MAQCPECQGTYNGSELCSECQAEDRPSLETYIRNQREWSERTFGPGKRTGGISEHIRKELTEIEEAPDDPMEWIDVAILAFDGAWRAGYSPEEIVQALVDKQAINFERKWPPPGPEDRATEHIRS